MEVHATGHCVPGLRGDGNVGSVRPARWRTWRWRAWRWRRTRRRRTQRRRWRSHRGWAHRWRRIEFQGRRDVVRARWRTQHERAAVARWRDVGPTERLVTQLAVEPWRNKRSPFQWEPGIARAAVIAVQQRLVGDVPRSRRQRSDQIFTARPEPRSAAGGIVGPDGPRIRPSI